MTDIEKPPHGFTTAIVRSFLESNLSLVLILLAMAAGSVSLLVTPREEDPQIIVPMADVLVSFPGRSAREVERLAAGPLEKILYHIDGVECVYSMAREGQAVITVRFHVGQDRERSLVKLFKTINENLDVVPPGVAGWLVKPVEIDDVPIVTLALTSAAANEYLLRRTAEECAERLAAVQDVSRCRTVGGLPRAVMVYLDPARLEGHRVSPLEVARALEGANVSGAAGDFQRNDKVIRVDVGRNFAAARELEQIVVGVSAERPVFLSDVADVRDGPAERAAYVRLGWGPGRNRQDKPDEPGATVAGVSPERQAGDEDRPAVTISIAKKKGTNAVWVARDVMKAVQALKKDFIPDDIDVVVTRNAGLDANDKVNELTEALAVALIFVLAVVTYGLGWRESLIVALAVPVVFGITLLVNLICGYTLNRVTLFALILSIGLLVDDPIVDVENISRHFAIRRRASRGIVLEAVAEIRPPLITATIAVILSFLPMVFISGMMGPYIRPMALNVPVTMMASMAVSFTITPWLTYHFLRRRYDKLPAVPSPADTHADPHAVRADSVPYRAFRVLVGPLLRSRRLAWTFLGVMAAILVLAAGLAAVRRVPLKMLPFGNKNSFQVVMDLDEGTTLERTDAAVRAVEEYLRNVPEVACFTSYVGLASPMDFNGMVRHYYLRQGQNVADIQVNIVDRKKRSDPAHALALRLRDDLKALAARHGANLKIVEAPPGPPTLSPVVAEVYGRPDHSYEDLVAAARVVRARMEAEPGLVDVDDLIEAEQRKMDFLCDQEKLALHGVSVAEVVRTAGMALGGAPAGTLRLPEERNPLLIELRLRRDRRSDVRDLARLTVKGPAGRLVPLSELGRWVPQRVDQTIYHKDLRPVMYVLADVAGRPPTDPVIDIGADRVGGPKAPAPAGATAVGSGWVAGNKGRPVASRTFFRNGGGVAWQAPEGIEVDLAGEGEWKMTIEVFRDMGLAYAAALVGIYILLVAQTGSFLISLVLMLSIPLTIIGIMPGFWLLNVLGAAQVGNFRDPIFFTATGMIGMIALAGIVIRNAIILVDFIHLSLRRGRTLADAIVETCAVRVRPILLTAATAMLSAIPIAADPVFSGLAWSLIFGLLASTLLTLFVVPVTYWLIYANKPGHGVNTTGP